MAGRYWMRRLARGALYYLGVVAGAMAGLLICIYVETNARDLELPLAGAGLLVGIIGGLWWWRWRGPKRLQWLPAGMTLIGFVAAGIFAYMAGWGGAVAAIYGLGVLAFPVASVVLLRKFLRAVYQVPPELAIEAGQPLSPDAQDETNAIRVYPSKKRLLQLLLVGIVALAACGSPGLIAYEQPAVDDAQGIVVLSSVACVFCLLAILITIRQFIRTQPLFTISDAGMHIRKMTLVRWREIVGMYIAGEGSAKSWSSRRSLVLVVANPNAVISRQPRRWQCALRLGNAMFGSPVAISEQQLPMSLEDVEAMFVPYLKRAHGDDWADGDASDVPDDETDPAQD